MTKYEKMRRELREAHEVRVLRVGAYCRVSTDKEDQANSFESQQRYFREYIERKPNWELTEVFADEGKSGTSTKKRTAFNRMITRAKCGELDLIITKEISRFARNTLDSIYYTRELKRIGVGVIFMNDNINTLEPDAELRLTIMSSIAQEESRKTSDRVKWGQKRRMEQGVVFGRDMLGYDLKDGIMSVNEEGAKIVRLIFHKFVTENKGCHTIARELREAGIQTTTRMKEWSNTVILRIVRNEKYCGDLVQKKTFTPDYLSHDKKYNRGEEEFVIIRDHHEPIVSREVFEQAGAILDSRTLSPEGKAKHSKRYPLSGKIKCGKCGASFAPHYRERKDGTRLKKWRCYEANRNGVSKIDPAGNRVGCEGGQIREDEAMYIIRSLMKTINIDRGAIRTSAARLARMVIDSVKPDVSVFELESGLRQVEEKRAKLLDLYMSNELNKPEYLAARDKYDAEAEKLTEQMEGLRQREMIAGRREELLKDIESAIDELTSGDTEDEDFYREFLSRMVVNDSDNVDVYLNLLPFRWSYAIQKANFMRHTHVTMDTQAAHEVSLDSCCALRTANVPTFGSPVGTEELSHFEMVGTLVYQLTRDLSEEQIKASGFDTYFVDHTAGIYPAAASGAAWTADYIASKGDVITDLTEDMAAEQKARTTYDNILRFCDDPDVADVIKFLRAREIVHFQRFGEGLRLTQDKLDSKNIYALNPAYDK